MRLGVSVAALMVIASVACDQTTTGTSKTNSVTVGDNYFAPDPDTVSVGDSVLFVWAGSATHDVRGLSDGVTWCAPRGGGFCTVKFLTKGTFPYFCIYHGGMQATIEVK